MAWVRWIELVGTLETPEEINAEYMEQTGATEPWIDEDNDKWRAWVECENGKTYLLAEIG